MGYSVQPLIIPFFQTLPKTEDKLAIRESCSLQILSLCFIELILFDSSSQQAVLSYCFL